MAGTPEVVISAAVEGIVDESVVRRLAGECGIALDAVYGKAGKRPLLQRLGGYNNAAKYAPWIVLVDMDHDADCAPPLLSKWVRERAPGLHLRIVIREIESWLLGDSERFSRFFSVPRSAIPAHPETLEDPKQVVVSLARRSRRRAVRDDMVPGARSGRTVGVAYASELISFVGHRTAGWRPEVAAEDCDSLRRCIARLRALAGDPRNASSA